jgi:molecular chaperone Hsp33
LEEEKFAMLSEHPDCDMEWFNAVTAEEVGRIHEVETTNLMERRIQRWHCGCNQKRMLQVLAPAYKAQGDELYGDDAAIEIRCPRCSARHVITREALDAYVAAVSDE